jgi:hypothetical protein
MIRGEKIKIPPLNVQGWDKAHFIPRFHPACALPNRKAAACSRCNVRTRHCFSQCGSGVVMPVPAQSTFSQCAPLWAFFPVSSPSLPVGTLKDSTTEGNCQERTGEFCPQIKSNELPFAKSLAEFRPPQWTEKIEIPKFPRTCALEILLLRLRTVRPAGVRGAVCILFEKIEDFRETC